MSSNKTYKTRILNKIDTVENWEKAENFTPLKGELVIYTDDDTKAIRIGDGETLVNDLPIVNTVVQLVQWGADD